MLDAVVDQFADAIGRMAERLGNDVDPPQERTRLLLDEMAAKMSEIANRPLFTLSILTACLLPPTLVTGFFGMNTKDLPWQSSDGGTWLALTVAVIVGAASYWALRRMRAF